MNVTIKSGAKAIDVSTKALRNRSNPIRVQFNQEVTLPVLEIEERGKGEWAHKQYLVEVEGKTLSVHENNVTNFKGA